MARRGRRVLPFVVGIGVGAAALRRLARVGLSRREAVPSREAVPPRDAVPPSDAVPPTGIPTSTAETPAPHGRWWPIVAVAVVLATVAGVATALIVDEPASRQAAPLDVADVDVSFEGRTARWVQEENQRDGTSEWRLNSGETGDVEAFADAASAVQGDAVSLFVSTSARTVQVRAYRLGWYGGDGGRLVWESAATRGRRQPEPLVEPRTGMVEADWSPSMTVRITSRFVPGMYLFKVVGSNGEQAHVPLVVRHQQSEAVFLVLDSVTARMATTEGRAFSLDKPVDAAGVVRDELPVIALMESLGLDVTYAVDVDLHRRQALPDRHRVVVVLGRDGYWSEDMRRRLADANVLLVGPAVPPRRVRLEDSPLGFGRRAIVEAPRAAPLTGARVARVADPTASQEIAETLRSLS